MSAAAGDVAYLEKKGWNAHFKYAFVQEAEVKRAVSEALRKHGLMIQEVGYTPVGDCNGKAATISCQVTIRAVKGDGYALFSGVGSGADSSDKAPMKAMAAALKYALTSGFLIATGDDPEEDGGSADKQNGKTEPKDAKSKPAPEPANDNATPAADPCAEMTAKVNACASLDDLNKLKIAVSKLRNEPGFKALAEAFRAKGKSLTDNAKEAA
jgi:hypothetical protein